MVALVCILSFGAMAAETVTEPIKQYGYGSLTSSAFSTDGTKFLTGSVDGKVRLWDVGSGKEIQTFTGSVGEIYAVAFSPDGKGVLASSGDRTVRFWDVENGDALKTFSGHTG